jgi:hypothetical protein
MELAPLVLKSTHPAAPKSGGPKGEELASLVLLWVYPEAM